MNRSALVACSALLLLGAFGGQPATAGDDHSVLRVSPGRVFFTMKANGEWTGFGVRGERPLLEHGGVVIYSGRAGSNLFDEVAASVRGGMHGIKSTGEHETLFEGMRGGARYPSIQPDDDGDGRVNEDPWDGIDNDGDGQVDEDFAAIGDEMTVAIYASKGDASFRVHQECYAWSLANIDGMVASALTITNTGQRVVPHARIGIQLETVPGLELGATPVIETSRRNSEIDAAYMENQLVFDDHDRGLGVLVLVPRAQVVARGAPGQPVAWEVRGDHGRVVVITPDLGDLAPEASVTLDVGLVELPADDLKAARALRNAHRTIVGDGTANFIPPPVSVLVRGDGSGAGTPAASPAFGGGGDPFWNTPGKLEEKLLVGSPNPFRDAVNIDYEIPSRVVDEDGVEHVLDSSGIQTSVKIYNVTGRLVATLVDQPHNPGKYRTDWVARNEGGDSVASGVYYVKLQIGKRSVTMRMVQLK